MIDKFSLNSFNDEFIQNLKNEMLDKLSSCKNQADLISVKSYFIGKEGKVTSLLKNLMKSFPDQKKDIGIKVNELRSFFSDIYSKQSNKIEMSDEKVKSIDYSIPVYSSVGKLNPMSIAVDKIHSIMQEMGFIFEDGPSIEKQYYNFDALNISESHPSRNERDTFFIENDVLRTHTTAVQIRALESQKHKNDFRIYSIGDVYRRDDDSTHLPMFHQIEGFIVEESASISILKGFLIDFLQKFFEQRVEIRLRPGFFPFTEPSMEVDMKFDGGKWLEILGSGMIRQNILQKYNYKNGFAFGIGLERITMIKFGINNMHDLVNNNYPWLIQ